MGPYIITALRARELHKRDVNYIVRDGEVKIVNPSTGRVMPTSRWTDDLHQVLWPYQIAGSILFVCLHHTSCCAGGSAT